MTDERIIRDDLEEIKYYSTRKYVLDSYMKDFCETNILDLMSKYNAVIKHAPIKFYHLYVLIYLKGNTQEFAADEMGFAINTVQTMQKNLILWLCENIKKEEAVC